MSVLSITILTFHVVCVGLRLCSRRRQQASPKPFAGKPTLRRRPDSHFLEAMGLWEAETHSHHWCGVLCLYCIGVKKRRAYGWGCSDHWFGVVREIIVSEFRTSPDADALTVVDVGAEKQRAKVQHKKLLLVGARIGLLLLLTSNVDDCLTGKRSPKYGVDDISSRMLCIRLLIVCGRKV